MSILLMLLGACQNPTQPADITPSSTAPVAPATRPPGAAPSQSATPAAPAASILPSPYPPPPLEISPTPFAYPGGVTPKPPTPVPTSAPNKLFKQYLPLTFYNPTPVVLPSPTPRPEPTDTPRPPWPEPLAGQTASKLGLHVLAVFVDPDIVEFARRVHPRVVNAPDDPAGLAQIKAVSPSTITLARINVPGQNDWVKTVPDPVAAANHYVAVNLDQYRQNPAVDYWEGINEFNPQTPEEWNWFAQFEATRVCAMQAQGLRGSVGEFSAGWPNTYEQMQLFLPALEAAHRCGGIFTLHEYNGPTFQQGVSVNTPGIIPGAPALSVPAGTLSLRYRFWYEGFLKPRGLGDLPLVITELAITSMDSHEGCTKPGPCYWKDYQAWWVQQGYGPTGPEAYVNVLAWYDAEMRKDPYVIGATIFTTGEFRGGAWYGFDLFDVLIPLAQYEARLQP